MGEKEGYVPGPDFKEDHRLPLHDIHINHDTELWLVQIPHDHFPDFERQEISLDLDKDGEIGSLKGADGKVYNLVNFPSDVAETTIFQPSQSGTRIVGKISRHVSLVRFPEPDELGSQAVNTKKTPMTSKTTYTKSRISTPSKSISQRSPQSQSQSQTGHRSRNSTSNSRKSGLSTENSSRGHSTVTVSGSSRGHSSITASGSSEQSHRKKSKMKT